MQVLIVESRAEVGRLWQSHLERQDMHVTRTATQDAATAHLSRHDVDVVILDLVLQDGSALAVADYVQYRQPDAKVIFVTSSTFFSDGSIFGLCANARAFLPVSTPPEDLAAMVEHYGTKRP